MGKFFFKVKITSKKPEHRQIVVICRQNDQCGVKVKVVEGESLLYFANNLAPDEAYDVVRRYQREIEDDC